MYKNFFNKINNFIRDEYLRVEPHLTIFGVVLIIGFLGFYLLNYYFFYVEGYENLLLRASISILAIPLIFRKYLSKNISKFMPLYWHLTLLYSLSFFFTFMFLKNSANSVWQINALIGIFILGIITSWVSFIFILILGMILGFIFYWITTFNPSLPPNIIGILISYSPAIIYLLMFADKQEKIHQQKITTLRSLGGTIAHEMRTPLAAISTILDLMKIVLPDLITSYRIATKSNIPLPEISEHALRSVGKTPERVEIVNKGALLTIDMLLVSLKSDIETSSLHILNIKECIKDSLEKYYLNEEEKKLINLDIGEDFEFKGNEELFRHIMFNLLKNALYYMRVARKGSILIKTVIDNKNNKLIFKDTGKGIKKEVLPYIFDKFYTKTEYGAGLGLAFCEMAMKTFGGKISCKSTENEFTEFILEFPKLNKKE